VKQRFRNHAICILCGPVQDLEAAVEDKLAFRIAPLYLRQQSDEAFFLLLALLAFGCYDQIAVNGIQKKSTVVTIR